MPSVSYHIIGGWVADNLTIGSEVQHKYATSKYRVPQGPKGHGYYFIRAEPGPEGKWEGVRCELQLDATTELEEEQFRDKRCLFCRCHTSIY